MTAAARRAALGAQVGRLKERSASSANRRCMSSALDSPPSKPREEPAPPARSLGAARLLDRAGVCVAVLPHSVVAESFGPLDGAAVDYIVGFAGQSPVSDGWPKRNCSVEGQDPLGTREWGDDLALATTGAEVGGGCESVGDVEQSGFECLRERRNERWCDRGDPHAASSLDSSTAPVCPSSLAVEAAASLGAMDSLRRAPVKME